MSLGAAWPFFRIRPERNGWALESICIQCVSQQPNLCAKSASQKDTCASCAWLTHRSSYKCWKSECSSHLYGSRSVARALFWVASCIHGPCMSKIRALWKPGPLEVARFASSMTERSGYFHTCGCTAGLPRGTWLRYYGASQTFYNQLLCDTTPSPPWSWLMDRRSNRTASISPRVPEVGSFFFLVFWTATATAFAETPADVSFVRSQFIKVGKMTNGHVLLLFDRLSSTHLALLFLNHHRHRMVCRVNTQPTSCPKGPTAAILPVSVQGMPPVPSSARNVQMYKAEPFGWPRLAARACGSSTESECERSGQLWMDQPLSLTPSPTPKNLPRRLPCARCNGCPDCIYSGPPLIHYRYESDALSSHVQPLVRRLPCLSLCRRVGDLSQMLSSRVHCHGLRCTEVPPEAPRFAR